MLGWAVQSAGFIVLTSEVRDLHPRDPEPLKRRYLGMEMLCGSLAFQHIKPE
jgi:hypothetical protein